MSSSLVITTDVEDHRVPDHCFLPSLPRGEGVCAPCAAVNCTVMEAEKGVPYRPLWQEQRSWEILSKPAAGIWYLYETTPGIELTAR